MTGGISNNPEWDNTLKERVKAESAKLGFCFCGFTDAAPLSDFAVFTDWISQKHYGTMAYLAREDTLRKRSVFEALFSGVKSICVLGVPYHLFDSRYPLDVASFARYQDYHDVIPEMASRLMEAVGIHEFRVCVDSSPVLERSLAVRAGLGWIGKSSMFIHPRFGSAVLLCEIFLKEMISPDPPYSEEHCGKCRRCLDACPANCIEEKTRTIRAEDCAAYLTIEHKTDFDPSQRGAIGRNVFGCDSCIKACPWNHRNHNASILPIQEKLPEPEDLDLNDAEFKEKYAGSPILRVKNKGLKRNIEASLKNQRLV